MKHDHTCGATPAGTWAPHGVSYGWSACARHQVGWFLHTPFPSSEIYRTLPVREEVLKAVLRADLIGFHTYDYARHFVSACTRILGLEARPPVLLSPCNFFTRWASLKRARSAALPYQPEFMLHEAPFSACAHRPLRA